MEKTCLIKRAALKTSEALMRKNSNFKVYIQSNLMDHFDTFSFSASNMIISHPEQTRRLAVRTMRHMIPPYYVCMWYERLKESSGHVSQRN